MNVVTICVLAIVAIIIITALKAKNSEIALMLSISASILILFSVITSFSQVADTINNIIAVSGISTNYITILLKVIGICLLTEFTVNACKDAGSNSLANNVSLAGKILITVTSIPLYNDILNTVLSLSGM